MSSQMNKKPTKPGTHSLISVVLFIWYSCRQIKPKPTIVLLFSKCESNWKIRQNSVSSPSTMFQLTSVRMRRPGPQQQTDGQIRGCWPGGSVRTDPDLSVTLGLRLELETLDTPPDPPLHPEPPEERQEVMFYSPKEKPFKHAKSFFFFLEKLVIFSKSDGER